MNPNIFNSYCHNGLNIIPVEGVRIKYEVYCFFMFYMATLDPFVSLSDPLYPWSPFNVIV